MDWSNEIPTQTSRTYTEKKQANLLSPFWLLKTAFLGLLLVVGYYLFKMFSTPIFIDMFGPLVTVAAIGLCTILVAGLAFRVAWWVITLPFRLLGAR